MATPKTQRFGAFILMMETAHGSGLFTAPIGFIKRGLKITNQTSDTIVVDPENPDAPCATERNTVSQSWEISSSGALAIEDYTRWEQAADDGLTRQFQIIFAGPGANGGRTRQGGGIVSDVSLDSDKKSEGGRTQISITVQSDGPSTVTISP
jgi:hypothetical protein